MEAFFTLKTVGCKYNKCKFCGLGTQDWMYQNPLAEKEFLSQLKSAKEQVEARIDKISKVSLIDSAHSTVTKDVIEPGALKAGIKYILDKFPAIRQLSLETCANLITERIVSEIQRILRDAGRMELSLEMAVGVENALESVRNGIMKKGLTDKQIYAAARILAKCGCAMRAYFIYNCPGRPFEERTNDFVAMAGFLSRLKSETGLSVTLYANRGYVPQGRTGEFKNFKFPNDREAISDLLAASKVCKQGGVTLEMDVTGSDEKMTSASSQKITSGFEDAINTFNKTQDVRFLEKFLAQYAD